jgi:transcription elongation GreA/GreB family factor
VLDIAHAQQRVLPHDYPRPGIVSVAFRRDSDEEHLEPRFELPIPPGPNLVTSRGYQLIEGRTRELEEALAAAPTEERRKELLRDLRYWRTRLATAQLAPPPNGETVAIGTRVEVEIGGKRRILRVVGHDESDAASNRIAFSAPLARALMGAEEGEEVALPGSAATATVLKIEIDHQAEG